MVKIFISYRRDDSADATGRLYDHLESHFGAAEVFIDVDTIPLGVDFRKHLSDAVSQCDVLLAIIGEKWLTAAHAADRRRLDDPRDFVRIELEAALARGIPVIPVLVGRGQMPSDDDLPPCLKDLAFRNAAEVRSGATFKAQVERLIRGIEKRQLASRPPPPAPPLPAAPKSAAPAPQGVFAAKAIPVITLPAGKYDVECPACRKALRLSEANFGKQSRCPVCQAPFLAERSQTGTKCPACASPIVPGAIACMDCGFLLVSDLSKPNQVAETPNLCVNPACGVANQPRERNCIRCGSPMPTMPGTLLHKRYRIEKLLAMGGFGGIYLATDTKFGATQVAVKDMICSDPQEFAIRLNFFRREAEILRLLASVPAVPRFYELIEEGQSAYIVMEYLKGRDLLRIMENDHNRPFPLDKVIPWGIAACEVLEAMHALDPPWVYRDMKPDNLFLMEDGSLKLIDFGTARDIGKTAKERIKAKTRIYTEGYAPPEQIIGKPVQRSDLFSLAATLFHLATGKAPEGFYTAKELDASLTGRTNPIPKDDRWFYELLQINLAEDVHDRYLTAQSFKFDLERRRLTKGVLCRKCKQPNKPRDPYCTACDAPLTPKGEMCLACGFDNRLGSRVCRKCQNRLR